jgi:branched-chain amino acid transport system substrate-binding protein
MAGVDIDTCGDVVYQGQGEPDALIVSDLPLQGDSKDRSNQMNFAVEEVLGDSEYQAGDTTVAFQACDDSVADTGLWDEQTCKDNAQAYADNDKVIGVIGTYNSGCAELMIPILNQAEGGEVAMVSPGNTAVCLTEPADTCENGTPDSLYPTGNRNYARVVPNDAFQGAGLVTFAKKKDYQGVAVFYAADDPTSLGQAKTFVNAAKPAGVDISMMKSWDPEAKSYKDLMTQAADADVDAVLLAGLTEQNGGQLIKDKVAVLGPNSGVGLMAPDGFAQQSTIDDAGSAAKGMFASVPGRAPSLLSGPGEQLVQAISLKVGKEVPVELYAPYAGQAADVMLQAIASGGTDRGATTEALYGLKVPDGIVGKFEITDTGDPNVGPITINKAGKTFEPAEVILPASNLVTAARGEN